METRCVSSEIKTDVYCIYNTQQSVVKNEDKKCSSWTDNSGKVVGFLFENMHRGVQKRYTEARFPQTARRKKMANTKIVYFAQKNPGKLSNFVCFEHLTQGCPRNL
jgi:hypothetical protein